MDTSLIVKTIKYIKDPDYVVMWVSPHGGNYILQDKITEENNELIVMLEGAQGHIDLYNMASDDIKIYKEIE